MSVSAGLDVRRVRGDFPILGQRVHGRSLVYLDNAATTQKPASVIRALQDYYGGYNANVHRGLHALSERATEAFEQTRVKVRRWINAADPHEIVYVRGTTEAINLVAQSYGRPRLGAGDQVLITQMEHHANIVPWQMVCEQTGAELRVAPINDAGEVVLEAFEAVLGDRTRIVAVTHVSNALGTVNPVRAMVEMAQRRGAVVLVDGAQAVPHQRVDVRALGCDFYAFSSHKVFGPTGVGVLYGKKDLLEAMPPYQGGGDMIRSVTFEKTVYNDVPYKFEAGTPHIAGVIGMGAAIDYLEGVGMDRITAYERQLLAYGERALSGVAGLRMIGTAGQKAGVLSFVLEGVHPHDIGTILDQQGVAVRTGHHCAQPVMERFGVPATARASVAFYNTAKEIDALVEGLGRVIEVFR